MIRSPDFEVIDLFDLNNNDVAIVGSNDVVVSMNYDSLNLTVKEISGAFATTKENAAIASAVAEQGSADAKKVTKLNDDVIVNFKKYYNDAIPTLIDLGYMTYARFLLSVPLEITHAPTRNVVVNGKIVQRGMTLAISYNPIKKTTTLYINPAFIAETVETDLAQVMKLRGVGEEEAVSLITAYMLAHECTHLFQGHLTGGKSYNQDFDNIYMDMSINKQLSAVFYNDSNFVVDGGMIMPLFLKGNVSFTNYSGFNNFNITGSQKLIPENPCLIVLVALEGSDITRSISRLVDLKTQFSLEDSLGTMTSATSEARAPDVDPELAILESGTVVMRRTDRMRGVVVIAGSPNESDRNHQQISVLYEDAMTPDEVDIITDGVTNTVSDQPTLVILDVAQFTSTPVETTNEKVLPYYKRPLEQDQPSQPEQPQPPQPIEVGSLVKTKIDGKLATVTSITDVDGDEKFEIEFIPKDKERETLMANAKSPKFDPSQRSSSTPIGSDEIKAKLRIMGVQGI